MLHCILYLKNVKYDSWLIFINLGRFSVSFVSLPLNNFTSKRVNIFNLKSNLACRILIAVSVKHKRVFAQAFPFLI